MDQSLQKPHILTGRPAKTTRPLSNWFRRVHRHPTMLVGIAILGFWLVMAVVGQWIAPYGVNEITPGAVWHPPSAEHLMGTDNLGRDLFSRLIVGARQMVLLPTLSVCLAILLGTSIGLASGYFGGWLDEIIMRVMDVIMAFPVLMLYLLIIVAIGASAVNVVLALGLGATPAVARLARSLVLDLRNREFVAAARMRGESTSFIIFQEILPNAMGPILVDGLVRIGYASFSMGALGFLGLGVPPPAPDWGQMVSQARTALLFTPTAPLFPALSIASLVVSFNLIADGMTELAKGD